MNRLGKTEVFLNRFALRPLGPEELRPWRLKAVLDPPPGREEVYPLLAQLARQVGGITVRAGDGLASWSPPEALVLEGILARKGQTYTYRLYPEGRMPFDPKDPGERGVLSALARRLLQERLRQLEGLWVEGRAVYRKEHARGAGWRVLRGAVLDLWVSDSGAFLLEVDPAYRILCELSLEAWLAQGHPLPKRVRNAYDKRTWELLRIGEEDPKEVLLPGGLSLLDYHASKGHLQGREEGRVAWVADPEDPRKAIPHLTGLLVPILTLEDIQEDEGGLVLSLRWEERRKRTQKIAEWIGRRLDLGRPEPVRAQAYRLSAPRLLGQKAVKKPADALRVGLYRAQATVLSLLRLDEMQGWPDFLRRALDEAFRASGASLRLHELRADPAQAFAFREALREAKEKGVQAILVLTPPMTWEARNRLKALFLREGLPSQILNLPLREGERHRWENALLGLLAKAGLQVVALQGTYPAELAVGFDAGGRESFRFGGAACAVGEDGSHLLWTLPEAQAGERIPQEVVRDLLEETLWAFRREAGRLPSRVLLLRDGRVPQNEFTLALEALAREGIAYDLVSVRKSGGGRIYPVQGRLVDGLYVPLEDRTFLLLTVHRDFRGTPRPLKLVHEAGDTPLEALAAQIYHLTRLYPASGFAFPRLPAPLHLADRLVKEVGRLGVRHLKEVDRRKLFFV
ncbi:argonaute PAZ domain-containing protein [Thermus sp.]|uniref:argonaute PAZ domain-containing protein n=1 Tax=Thermus sp. TaxID=275 RepID=UPI003D14C6F6